MVLSNFSGSWGDWTYSKIFYPIGKVGDNAFEIVSVSIWYSDEGSPLRVSSLQEPSPPRSTPNERALCFSPHLGHHELSLI